ncbi:hypothetical protein EV174_006333 [Coemansia sp. RSA 2320]|nr:hypothetical protein EV174_006333 [Coemansia sp. RSA 2320]
MISRATSSTKPGTHAVTVELKPKCMILPRSEFTSPESSVKHKVCWYCMHQYTLRKDGKVSKFCPLELFSRDFGRISRSLDAFAQSPHNNLVVFVDGRSVVDEQGKISERCVPHWKMLRDAVAAIVQKEALFPMLQRAQRNLDLFNIESILPIYKRALGTGVLTTEEPPVTTWLDAHAACKQRQGRECSICTRIGDKQAIMEYMLSTTLKDASILIKFAGWPARGQASSSSMANPAYTIGIVDHDPKKVGNIPKYFKNDQDIVATYLAHNPNPVDQRPCHE